MRSIWLKPTMKNPPKVIDKIGVCSRVEFMLYATYSSLSGWRNSQ
jgi:hypothetical protein